MAQQPQNHKFTVRNDYNKSMVAGDGDAISLGNAFFLLNSSYLDGAHTFEIAVGGSQRRVGTTWDSKVKTTDGEAQGVHEGHMVYTVTRVR